MSLSFAAQQNASLEMLNQPEKNGEYISSERSMNNFVMPQSLSKRQLHPALDSMRVFCLVSHISLIVFLAAFACKPPEKGNSGFIFFSKPAFRLTDDDNATAQIFQKGFKQAFSWLIAGWTILLTLTTQRMALRRQLNLYNSLTAKHDANAAWMGLGSAVLTSLKWRQLGFRASLNSIFLPLVYLAGITSLHSIAGGMFVLVPKPTNVTVPFLSRGIPDFSGLALGNEATGSSALLTMSSLSDLDFPGLAPNGLGITYDIPDSSDILDVPSDKPVQVNATRYDVTCGSLSGAVEDGNFIFSSDMGVTDPVLFFPDVISQQALYIRAAPWNEDLDSDSYSWPASILVFSTINIEDSFKNVVPMVPVTPAIVYPKFNSSTLSTTSQVAALACNLTVDQISNKATIFPTNNTLLSLDGQGSKTTSQLSRFPPSRRAPLDPTSPEDNLIFLWSALQIMSTSPMNEQLQSLCLDEHGDTNATSCGTLYEAEQFVMESLNVFPDFWLPNTGTSSPTIQLSDLENVLSRMTAIEMWAEGQGKNLKFANTLDTSILTSESGVTISSATNFVKNNNVVVFEEFLLVFAIDRVDLFVSIAISMMLLLLAMPSLLDNNNLKIDSIGILQMIWLANDHPEIQQSITRLNDPSVEDLRKEGIAIKRNFHRHTTDCADQRC